MIMKDLGNEANEGFSGNEELYDALIGAIRRALADTDSRGHPGLFITFEGGDGSGKTTQVRRIAQVLTEAGIPVLATREPGGTELGTGLRKLVMHGPEDVDPRTEALLYAADRAYHVATVIRPALVGGMVVVEDRYIDSSVAYQGAARELGSGEIRGLSEWATEGLEPDITVLFDVDSVVGIARTGSDLDRLERSGEDFHQRVRDSYLQMAEAEPERFIVVDASGDVESVFRDAIESLTDGVASLGIDA
ncbi:dTMP kinase [Actinomycetaceae bacterium MB13-C1-2]|nr:dTMP kinase [Actinomycetaceae bacterium MB13-C1-2]